MHTCKLYGHVIAATNVSSHMQIKLDNRKVRRKSSVMICMGARASALVYNHGICHPANYCWHNTDGRLSIVEQLEIKATPSSLHGLDLLCLGGLMYVI